MVTNSVVTHPDGSVHCSCGATADRKDSRRFLRRHPALCNVKAAEEEEKREVSKELARGTRAVDDAEGRVVGPKRRNGRVSLV